MVHLGSELNLGLDCGGIGEEEEGRRLGDVLGKGVVENHGIVARLAWEYIVSALSDLVRLASANPGHLLEPNASQLLNDNRGRILRLDVVIVEDKIRRGRRKEGDIRGLRGLSASYVPWVLEDAEVDRLLVRLHRP